MFVIIADYTILEFPKFLYMSILRKYFNWLQKDVPVGEVEPYPKIDQNGETTVKGIFVTGDLTGIPLLKLAAENGQKVVQHILNTDDFKKLNSSNSQKDIYDLIIVGAGRRQEYRRVWRHRNRISILKSLNHLRSTTQL